MRIMVTGHRNINEVAVPRGLRQLLERAQTKYDDVVAISGGARGADLTWARVARDMAVPFELWIPHPDYFSVYEPCDPEEWTLLQKQALKVVYSVPETVKWSPKHNFTRNVDLIDTSDARIVVSHIYPRLLRMHARGGTAHCVKQMIKRDIEGVHWVNADNGEVEWQLLRPVETPDA